MKPAAGSSYAEVLKELKQKVKPKTLGVKIRGIRLTRNGEVLVAVGPAAHDKSKLAAAIRVAVEESDRKLRPPCEDTSVNPRAAT